MIFQLVGNGKEFVYLTDYFFLFFEGRRMAKIKLFTY